MELRDILARRRMHRAFLPDPIPREQVERIARVIRRAPSGGFSQGQSIVVVTEAETRAEIARRFEEGSYPHPYLATAPVHMVISANERVYHDRYNEPDKLRVTGGVEVEWPAPFWFVDAGAAMMLLLLAAIDEGLAAGVYGVPVPEMQEFKALLGIPDDVAVVAGVTVGRGRPDPNAAATSSRFTQRRRSVDEVVRWERW